MGSEWCGDLPAVVVFVDVFVYKFVVKEAVDPVNTGISEHDETHNAEQNVTPVWKTKPCFASLKKKPRNIIAFNINH